MPPMSDARRLRLAKGLRASFPAGFPCLVDCSSCCRRPVGMLRVELEDLLQAHSPGGTVTVIGNRDAISIVVHDERGFCPWLNAETNRCGVYQDRPIACRSYGQHVAAWCREGVVCPPGAKLPEAVADREATLHGSDSYSAMSPQQKRAYAIALEEWRKVHGLPLDMSPSPTDNFDRESFSLEFERALVWLKAQAALDARPKEAGGGN